MKNVLRIVAGLVGILFFLNGLQWIISPANVAASLGMPLLEGVGLSTQIGDLGSFFITVGAMTLIGAITTTRHWFYAPSMLLLVAALYRTLSTILYGAPFVMSAILVEVVVGLFLIFAGSKISIED
ncbi:hypothetical protein OAK96_04840 [Pseudomonadota bacterium]|jgi:hypothetical protein|nr:hypothetical protein [Gammaproteobacteria bacterium]MDC0061407.1 hypothetical protein [Pseudomonadota bacterium]MDC0180031.1 hypothetical protein [Pseudomonadota bacterium]MDC0244562.1 hypothetical protein [Pseudomonadota bacterium]RPF90818.1 MAG: hypothetical protein CBD20_005120 [Rhodobacteraceae bacterium TMED160]|tara:strand:+ start:640 stop:1017 length:378 start_codon:yes stop_codon:yes gene_type:complete